MVREGRRVYVRMRGPEYLSDEELLRRADTRERELQRTVRELEQRVSELKLRASELERERDEARESAATAKWPYHELEREYQREVAEHKVTNDVLNIVRLIAFVLLALLIGSVLLWWFVLRYGQRRRPFSPSPRVSGSHSPIRPLSGVHVPTSPIRSCGCPIAPSNAHGPVSPSRSCGCPMTVEGAPETNCLLRCDRMPRSP